jgi:hypothetical protein
MRASALVTVITSTLFTASFAGATLAADPPKEPAAVAQAAIDQAQRDGAAETAPVELKAAQDKMAAANRLIEKNKRRDYPLAQKLAEEAAADAQLAQAKTAASKAEKSLQEVQEGNRTLQEEMTRPNSR